MKVGFTASISLSLSQMRADVNASYLVKEIPDALIASLPLSMLDKANLNSLDQLDGRSWSRVQVNKHTNAFYL